MMIDTDEKLGDAGSLQFASISDDDLRNPLSVHFVGEVGRDD